LDNWVRCRNCDTLVNLLRSRCHVCGIKLTMTQSLGQRIEPRSSIRRVSGTDTYRADDAPSSLGAYLQGSRQLS
jgi:hypothetical protein